MATIHVMILIALWCGQARESVSANKVQACREVVIGCVNGKYADTIEETGKLAGCITSVKVLGAK